MKSKRCSSCKQSSPDVVFNKNVCTRDGLQNVCTSCKAAMTRNWRHSLKSGQLEQWRQEQGGRCKICCQIPTQLVIDHCHRTGLNRGLLCRKCNALLGMCDDNIETLINAISYLKENLQC